MSDNPSGAGPARQSAAEQPAPVAAEGHPGTESVVRVVLLATAAVCLVLLAFAWPTRTSSVKGLPVDVVGAGAPAAQVTTALQQVGAFVVGSAPTRDAAAERIQTRQTYAAIVLPSGPGQPVEVLTASAAGPAVSQLMTQFAALLGQLMQAQAAATAAAVPTVVTTDLAPLAPEDSRGAGLAIAALPLAMGGMIGGVLIAMLVTGVRRRITAILGYAVLAGAGLTAILGPWFGFLPAPFVTTWAVMAASLLATAAFIVGMHALLGRPGIAVGAVVTLFVGNPLASANAPVEFLLEPWGSIGQYFVPGASVTLLRLTSYFPQASTLQPWLVLAAWTVVGLVCLATGHYRSQEVVHVGGEASHAPAEPAPA